MNINLPTYKPLRGGNPSINYTARKGSSFYHAAIGYFRCLFSASAANGSRRPPGGSAVSPARPMEQGEGGVVGEVPVMRANKMAGVGFPVPPASSLSPFPGSAWVSGAVREAPPHSAGAPGPPGPATPSGQPGHLPATLGAQRRAGEGKEEGADGVSAVLAWAASLASSSVAAAAAPGLLRAGGRAGSRSRAGAGREGGREGGQVCAPSASSQRRPLLPAAPSPLGPAATRSQHRRRGSGSCCGGEGGRERGKARWRRQPRQERSLAKRWRGREGRGEEAAREGGRGLPPLASLSLAPSLAPPGQGPPPRALLWTPSPAGRGQQSGGRSPANEPCLRSPPQWGWETCGAGALGRSVSRGEVSGAAGLVLLRGSGGRGGGLRGGEKVPFCYNRGVWDPPVVDYLRTC